jgi:hypothetical protein
MGDSCNFSRILATGVGLPRRTIQNPDGTRPGSEADNQPPRLKRVMARTREGVFAAAMGHWPAPASLSRGIRKRKLWRPRPDNTFSLQYFLNLSGT